MSEDLRYPLHWPKGYTRTRKTMQERSLLLGAVGAIEMRADLDHNKAIANKLN